MEPWNHYVPSNWWVKWVSWSASRHLQGCMLGTHCPSCWLFQNKLQISSESNRSLLLKARYLQRYLPFSNLSLVSLLGSTHLQWRNAILSNNNGNTLSITLLSHYYQIASLCYSCSKLYPNLLFIPIFAPHTCSHNLHYIWDILP